MLLITFYHNFKNLVVIYIMRFCQNLVTYKFRKFLPFSVKLPFFCLDNPVNPYLSQHENELSVVSICSSVMASALKWFRKQIKLEIKKKFQGFLMTVVIYCIQGVKETVFIEQTVSKANSELPFQNN